MKRKKGSPSLAFVVSVSILTVAVAVARTCRKPAPVRHPAPVSRLEKFAWPRGIKAAVSITFDHATNSQLDRGLPILDAHKVKASFYLDIPEAGKRLVDWRKAFAEGHEMANHSLKHPCSAGFRFERRRGEKYASEQATLEWVEADIMEANAELGRMFGAVPKTFSYPCGEAYVGKGEETRSYVPVVARHFIAGRGFGLDFSNNPADCDLAKVNSLAVDGFSFERFKRAIDEAVASGNWVIFCGHAVGEQRGKYPSIASEELEKLCSWLDQNRGVVWTGTVAEVAEYIVKARGAGTPGGKI